MSDEIISPLPEFSELDAKNLTHVKLPVFEGPLDLLLYLIKKDELDIYDIPIERITSQYLDYLRIIKMLDLEIAGDYLVVAATLLYIKSRVILPHDQRGRSRRRRSPLGTRPPACRVQEIQGRRLRAPAMPHPPGRRA